VEHEHPDQLDHSKDDGMSWQTVTAIIALLATVVAIVWICHG